MDGYEPLVSLAVALGVGLLVGLEREQQAPRGAEHPRLFIGGSRTFPLVALSGAVASLLGRRFGVAIPLAVLGAVVVFVAIPYWADVRRGIDRGITTEVAFVLTYLLGAVLPTKVIEPASWRYVVVAAVAVAMTVLLSLKPALHGIAERASRTDVYAVLKFLVLAVIVLPLLPNKTFGPLRVLNPFAIGLFVVLIAGLSFVGYVAVRILGPGRGLGLTGLLGGLVSSTAVTVSFARRARTDPGLADGYALAVVLASTVMFVRIGVLVAVVDPALLPRLLWPLVLMTVAGSVAAYLLHRRFRRGRPAGAATAEAVPVENPFELATALRFGALFAVVLLVTKAATVYLGSPGTYLAGALAGTTDVDAITLSMASLAHGGLLPQVAATTIILGAASNTLAKGAIAAVLGRWRFGREVLVVFGAMLAAGALGLLIAWV